jgi:hypothetical protein
MTCQSNGIDGPSTTILRLSDGFDAHRRPARDEADEPFQVLHW